MRPWCQTLPQRRYAPLVVGLTVVAYGTGSPELAVSVGASIAGEPDITVGNVVGSNIMNILLVLGLAACCRPISVTGRLVRFDVPLMVGASVMALAFSLGGSIGRLEGAILVGCGVGYSIWTVRQGKRESQRVLKEYQDEFGVRIRNGGKSTATQVALIIVGLVMLVAGAVMLVNSAAEIARELGASELLVGLTIVAIGTSTPEIATSIVASIRGKEDIAVGNVVGSNMFNILLVLGAASLLSPDGLRVPEAARTFDIPVMVAVAIACLPIFFRGHVIARWEGAIFLGYFLAYMTYLLLSATSHDALHAFSTTMLLFVVPLTIVTLLVGVSREIRSTQRDKGRD